VKAGPGPEAAAGGASNGPAGAALAEVVAGVTGVPAATLNAAGIGSGVTGTPQPITGSPLTSGGKPEVLDIGAEYCPFCAAERWAAVVALSRFGSFPGLRTVHSPSSDVDADTPTVTFYQATYTSRYVTFTPVGTCTHPGGDLHQHPPGSCYIPISRLYPAAETGPGRAALMSTYHAPPYVPAQDLDATPFYDFGNRHLISRASFSPQILDGKSWAQIAPALTNPASPVAQAVDGTANYLTAAICTLTGSRPASACTPTVKMLEKGLEKNR